MDEWITCGFTSFLTVFQSYQDNDNDRLCEMESRLRLRRLRLERGSNPGPLDQ